MVVGRDSFTRNPVEDIPIGGGKRIPCTWAHVRNHCPGGQIAAYYAGLISAKVFTRCIDGYLWICRYR